MRILYCKKYNFGFSGTEAYLFEAMELMRSRGHEVALFSMADPRGLPTPYDRHFMPHTDLKKQKVPVVYHLNDFKVLCASYNLVLRGEACEACKGGEFWHALKEKCYPGWGARMTLVAEAYVHKWLGTYRKCVDCFLAPSQFVRDKFVEHGWDPAKFEVLPHFQPVKEIAERRAENAPLLYFGRLSAEKGVDDLLYAMQRLPHLHLVIAGDGPERGRLQQLVAELGLANVELA